MKLNPKHSKKLRKHLRNNMTNTEIMLWSRLKGRQLYGFKIRRQYGIENYIIDFYCPRLRVGIEIDGESHFDQSGREHDIKRDKILSNQGIKLFRISTTEIRENLDGVIQYLEMEMKKIDPAW